MNKMMSIGQERNDLLPVCHRDDLIPGSGVCALIAGQQVALFYLPDEDPVIYAVENRDPIGKANVLSRGIVGDIEGQLVVASPLYKQHFSLTDGHCLEDPTISVKYYHVQLVDDTVFVSLHS